MAKRPERNIVVQQCREEHRRPASRLTSLFPVLIVALVSFGVYFNALFNGFVYDDHGQVLGNPWISDVGHLPDIFLRSVWSFQPGPVISNYYRPVMHCIYMLDYYVFGIRPWGFHLVNILFHTANSVLVLFVASRLLGASQGSRHDSGSPVIPARPGTFRKKDSRQAGMTEHDALLVNVKGGLMSPPFIAALLFAVHPIHSEAVTWVAGLPDLSFTFFFLLAFLFYIRSTDGETVEKSSYVLSVVSFCLGVFCKEPALTLPVMLFAYDFLVRKEKGSLSVALRRYIPYFIVSGVYLLLRFHALEGFAPEKRHTYLSAYEYAINVFPLFMQYLEKLLLPLDLNAFHVLHPISSLTDIRGLVAIVITAVFVLLLFISYKKEKTFLLGLLFIAVPLLPALYIPGLGENTFAERYLYLPSFGFVLLVSSVIRWARKKAGGAGIAISLLAAVTTLYAAGTVTRNYVWKSDLSLFSDTVRKSPDSALAHAMLGTTLLDMGKPAEAISDFDRAIALSPSQFSYYNNRGRAFYETGLFDKAVADFDKAISLNPRSSEAYINKGRLYGDTGFLGKAIEQFGKAIEAAPFSVAYSNRGLAYSLVGDYEKALSDLNRAIELDNRNSEAYGTRGNVYLRTGNVERAVLDFQKACDLGDKKGCDVLKQYGK